MQLFGPAVIKGGGPTLLVRVRSVANAAHLDPAVDALLMREGERVGPPPGNARVVVSVGQRHEAAAPPRAEVHAQLSAAFGYLEDGDVLRLNPRAQQVRVLYRRASQHNSLLVTEQCNSLCVMCSQPPRPEDDSYLIEEILSAIPLMAPGTRELGITGGEPTLRFAGLMEILAKARDLLPSTAVHVLTNGRLFRFLGLAERLAALAHPDLMLGIPLYSDLPAHHDYVVQAKGAFDQTVRGFLSLARMGVRTELRFVVHRDTYAHLPRLATFVARNLPFVSHVAIMGLEPVGWGRANFEALWIDPLDYQAELNAGVATLTRAGLHVSIYNHQLCVLDRTLWPWAVRSISDWKNLYVDACTECRAREACGGFFASAIGRHSRGILPLAATPVA